MAMRAWGRDEGSYVLWLRKNSAMKLGSEQAQTGAEKCYKAPGRGTRGAAGSVPGAE